ncbi:hypothetical protein ACH42_13535 [Endozoicomonas sp. (ex Bugula neritina AB1)]|nr:hypothetical protein ACH42_13535 [Endozoicomonas sp. (ex Bugula neritina AB1)]
MKNVCANVFLRTKHKTHDKICELMQIKKQQFLSKKSNTKEVQAGDKAQYQVNKPNTELQEAGKYSSI